MVRVRQFDVSAFFLRRKKVTRMDFKDWIKLICLAGNFVLALIDHFKDK